jgi:hypothetical protein
MRREAFARVGGYRELDGPEDYDLWLRLAAQGGRFAKVPRVLFGWRDAPGRLTRTDPRYRAAAFARLKAQHLAAGPLAALRGRPLIIWGAGRYGRWLGRTLAASGINRAAHVDIDPQKIGRTRAGAPVIAPADLARYPTAFVLGAVPIPEARAQIRNALRATGRAEGADFVICA